MDKLDVPTSFGWKLIKEENRILNFLSNTDKYS